MQRGTISYAKVRAISRIATPENEAQLLDLAYAGTAVHVERVVRAWRRCDRVEDARDTERRHLSRTVTTYLDDDGMLVLRARLTPELGAVVQRALDAASERLSRSRTDAATPTSAGEAVTAAQRRADALGPPRRVARSRPISTGDRPPIATQVVLHVEAAADGAVAVAGGDRAGERRRRTFLQKRRGASHATASVVVMRDGRGRHRRAARTRATSVAVRVVHAPPT